jgi:acetyltransferase-like isoleucine patch superfamily enzyme
MNIILSRILNKIAFLCPGGDTVRVALQRMRGVKVGNNVFIAQQVYFDELHPEAIEVGDNCTIGLRTSIFSHFYWGPRRENEFSRVVIGKDVYVGPHCLILPGVKIGEGAVIKGGTTISRNVPPRAFFGVRGPEILGQVTVPLTTHHGYEEFIAGLKPIRRRT